MLVPPRSDYCVNFRKSFYLADLILLRVDFQPLGPSFRLAQETVRLQIFAGSLNIHSRCMLG
jgi:hypothetical protein